jgi:hypothetical protein
MVLVRPVFSFLSSLSNTSGSAANAPDRIIYEKDTEKLFFGEDGTGGVARVLSEELCLRRDVMVR